LATRKKGSRAAKRTGRTSNTRKRKATALDKAVASLARAAVSRDRARTLRATLKLQAVASKSRAKSAKRERSRARTIERGIRMQWTTAQRNRASMAVRELVGTLEAALPQDVGEVLSGRVVKEPRKKAAAEMFLPVEEYQKIFGDISNVKGIQVTDADTGVSTWIKFDSELTHWPDLYAEMSARYKKTGATVAPYGK
jgi:hypothetical protein